MSRTNHHRRNCKRWNLTEIEFQWGWKTERRKVRRRYYDYIAEPREWIRTENDHQYGMETWDLRFYAGCRRRPQLIHKVLDFHGNYPWRFHHGPSHAGPAAEKWEGKLRTDVRRYVEMVRAVYNAGEDVDELHEPDKRPRSIEYDLW